MEALILLDRELFEAINTGWSNGFLDWLMPIIRNKYTWVPLYALLLVYFLKTFKQGGWQMAIFLVLTVVITDQLSASLLKPLFGRLRPCQTPELFEQINILLSCGNGKSFPSAHATNHFGVAEFLGLMFWTRSRWVLIIGLVWAVAVSLAQVYVAAHYPFDIATGAVLGILIGALMGRSCQVLINRIKGNALY